MGVPSISTELAQVEASISSSLQYLGQLAADLSFIQIKIENSTEILRNLQVRQRQLLEEQRIARLNEMSRELRRVRA